MAAIARQYSQVSSADSPTPIRRRWRKWMYRILAVLVAIIAAAAIALWWIQPAAVPAAQPVVPTAPVESIVRETGTGPVSGLTDGDIMMFKGIPYAAPPIGDLRWRAPQPASPWQGIRDASRFGNDCWQNRPDWDPARSTQPMSEDCLTINVWAPVDTPPGGAPVMFWIHGGGFVQGSSSQPALDGSAFARRGVILVSFNYRLGRFGFFAHPALAAEYPDAPTGNWGLMDQFAALQWVHDNIARFGGDPANVTLFGQSAGGASVAQLMLDTRARGLFSQAIIQSSGGRNRWVPLNDPAADKTGFGAGIAFAREQEIGQPSAASLRAIPAEQVLGDISMSKLSTDSYVGPMVDGRLVRRNFVEGFEAGEEAPVPLIVGTTDRELSHLPMIARYFLRQWAKQELGGALDRVRSTYVSSEQFDDNIVNDWGFVEPAITMARAHAGRGFPTWLYQFAYVSENRRDSFDGAPHASDVTFVFDTLGREGVPASDADRQMAQMIQRLWTTFASTGRPDTPASPVWPAFNSDRPDLLRIDMRGAHAERPARLREIDSITAAMNVRQRR